MSKGSGRRPCALTKEAEQLQWDRFEHKVTEEEYYEQRARLMNAGKWWKR